MNTNMRRNSRRVFPKSNSKYIQRSKPISKQVTYRFKKHVNLGPISSSISVANTYGAFTFRLQDIPNYTEMQAVFDAFRINAVRLTFIPHSNISQTNMNYDTRIVTAVDFNSATVPTSANQLRDYESCKVSPNNVLHTVYLKPKVNPLGTTGNLAGPQSWLSTTSSSSLYYAVLYAIENPSVAQSIELYRVEAKYYLEFKDPK